MILHVLLLVEKKIYECGKYKELAIYVVKHSWYIPYGDLLLTDFFIIFTIRILHNDSCLVFEFRLTHQVLTICWKIQIFNFKFLNWNNRNTSCASIIPNSYYTIFSFLSRSHHVSLFIKLWKFIYCFCTLYVKNRHFTWLKATGKYRKSGVSSYTQWLINEWLELVNFFK